MTDNTTANATPSNDHPRLVLFYDTETTGLPIWKEPSESEEQPHIIELAAILMDMRSKETIASMGTLVKPDGWKIPEEASAITGITTDYATERGIPEKAAVELFLGIWLLAPMRVAHNETFDARIIRIATKRFFDKPVQDAWKAGQSFCTMRASTGICQIPRTDGKRGYKFPKLHEAFDYFYDDEMDGQQHRAESDVKACRAIYMALREREAE